MFLGHQVNDEASDKVLQVEQDYNMKRQPIYKERNEIIRQMPDFWHEVFRGHETIRQFITAEDEEGLAHLQEVALILVVVQNEVSVSAWQACDLARSAKNPQE